MVSNKANKKTKKPIETTLGKCPKETEDDASQLRKPIETSVNGIKHIVAVWESATLEVKDLLSFECDIMYECKVCRSIFRSLANFLLHKRKYCTDKFLITHQLNNNINNNNAFEVNINSTTASNNSGLQPLEIVVQKLFEIDQVRKTAEKCSTEDLSEQNPVRNMKDLEVHTNYSSKTILEGIDSNSAGVFQSVQNNPIENSLDSRRNEFMKAEVMEIHKILQNDVPILDPDGKICSFTSSKYPQPSIYPKSDLKCIECNSQFATQKSLTTHLKLVHNPSRILYVCPTCKETFANPWCVYRHLLKVHRLTNKQVRRMREQIHNSCVRRDELTSVPKKKTEENRAVEDRDNQWINDIEGDNDFQMCAGCGKHFERKAALHSHSQMCAKRLEVCNNIKENARKKEEAIEKAKLDKVNADSKTLTGASKRKGRIICTYRRPSTHDEAVNPSLQVLSPSNSVDEAICLSSSDECCKTPPISETERQELTESPMLDTSSAVMEKLDRFHSEYLLRPDVSFETFCQKVDTDIKPIKMQPHSDMEDDVVFVSQSNPTSLTNLSYNNPLKFKATEASKCKLKRKILRSDPNPPTHKISPKSELSLLSRASPYIDRPNLRCVPCAKSFKTLKLLLYHMAGHFSWFRFQCAKCSFVTYSKFDCLAHCRKHQKMAEHLVLPIPGWKSIFLSHDFCLLTDFKKLKGRHTDEIIRSEESEQIDAVKPEEDTSDEKCMLFEESLVDIKTETYKVDDYSSEIDIDETNKDCTILPEPMELTMPANAHVSEMSAVYDDLDSKVETSNVLESAADESNDDWGLSKVCTINQCSDKMSTDETNQEVAKNEASVAVNIRPARVRTRAKKDDNFLYYHKSSRSLNIN